MKVLVKGPGQPGELQDFPDGILERMNALEMAVGGYIEGVRLSDTLYAIHDEKGVLKQKPHNVFGLAGTIVFCGVNEKGLTDVPRDDPLLQEVI